MSLVSNVKIAEYLGKPIGVDSKRFKVYQVDALGPNVSTLMFINKPDIDLIELDTSCTDCVFLIDEEYYGDMESTKNTFIRLPNPKFSFCEVVERFNLFSKLQGSFHKFISNIDLRERYRENLYCDEILIGDYCVIDKGVILGGTDFSPVLANDGTLVQFPQLGGVIIGDKVVIKYNTMIGKGTFGFTKIGTNTMIDYGCQIGHNCVVGKSCIIAAGTIIGGSTTIGDHTTIGIGAKIRNGLKIGNNVSIGMGAVVIRDVPDNAVVVGNPAREIEHKPMFDKGGLV